ncbi:poly-gamma-glutamate hydrolase family protein [Streptomyces lunaelactis]|uniref:poly-gamma-glutamate hydrolase family protein n=1 Tax=Streptomyces lunaelactis TaxID=1535768 RepID=UPI0015848400|nr:poly-gamma-glutamate hydrolase family protein [Streptomyces lunaelactis]NUL03605.1 poly-gamma-glutamate hydrolase family protein [Streptomyces lunaelactis]
MVYTSYADLAAAETEGVDYSRTAIEPTGATWAAIAIHGGGIEPGSGEMAFEVAGSRMRYYEFKGIKTSGNSVLHITSTLFDEPQAVGVVDDSLRTLSFHGYAGPDGVEETAIGGLDTALVARVTAALQLRGFTVITAPSEISGADPANICNENASAAGVQLEMSNALRASFFPNGDLSRTMRDSGQRTALFYEYATAVQSAYEGRGMVSQGSINASRYTLLTAPAADVDLTATVATDKLAVGGSHFVALAGRYADTSNSYLARIEFTTTQTVALTIRKRLAGVESSLAGGTVAGLIHAAGTRFGVRLQITGSALKARVWLASTPEPTTWNVETTDASLTAAGQIGTRSILSSANTNVLPVVASWDDLLVEGPQRFEVTRSVNGVVKAHASGTDVRLAASPIVPL